MYTCGLNDLGVYFGVYPQDNERWVSMQRKRYNMFFDEERIRVGEGTRGHSQGIP